MSAVIKQPWPTLHVFTLIAHCHPSSSSSPFFFSSSFGPGSIPSDLCSRRVESELSCLETFQALPRVDKRALIDPHLQDGFEQTLLLSYFYSYSFLFRVFFFFILSFFSLFHLKCISLLFLYFLTTSVKYLRELFA